MKSGGRLAPAWLLAAALAAAVFAVVSGVRQDYGLYLQEWAALDGVDAPWPDQRGRAHPNGNVYGPLFLAFNPLRLIHPLAPKAFFALCWAGLGILLLARTREGGGRGASGAPALLLAAPFFWIDVLWYGHFDVVVSLLCVLGLALLRAGREFGAGAAFGAGIALKFLPVFPLAVLCVEPRRLRRRLAAGAASVVLAIFGASYLRWGEAVFYPISANAQRAPKLLSILHFLTTPFSPLGLAPADAVAFAPPLLALLVALLGARRLRESCSDEGSAALAAVGACAIYHVGHPQFFNVPISLLAYWLCAGEPTTWRRMRRPVLAYAGWLSLFFVLYAFTDGLGAPPWGVLRQVGGLPTFALSAWVLAAGWAPAGPGTRGRSE